MNTLNQHKLYLLGSDEKISELSNKESAVILAVSDSHGRLEILKTILKEFGPKADALVFCGDGIEDLNKILNEDFIPPVVALVHGNGDESTMKLIVNNAYYISSEIKVPAAVNFNAAGTNILVTHGHMFGVYYGTAGLENHAKETGASLVFYGHSHIADISEQSGFTFINPGSCSLPRQGLPPSFAIIKTAGSKRPECTFYEIKVSLSEGFKFVPFSPALRRW